MGRGVSPLSALNPCLGSLFWVAPPYTAPSVGGVLHHPGGGTVSFVLLIVVSVLYDTVLLVL